VNLNEAEIERNLFYYTFNKWLYPSTWFEV